jgi:NAD(P)-dependent dehydrogenase (short-subunit alcohol dehydrogenase family)
LKLENKVALITGAASGIGRATAVVAAQEGANVVVVDINDKGGSETVQIIRRAGGRAVFRHLDVTKEDEIRPVILDIVREQGRIDFLHNNAGAWDLNMGDTLETTLEQWMHWINLDLTSLYLVSKYVVEDMKKRKAGAIVNTSSINAYYPYPGELAYASAKAGVIGFTKSMAIDWGRYNIRVNAVCPGEILTPAARDTFNRMPDPKAAMEAMKRQIPLGRFAEPEEVGKAVVWLGCDEASFISGTTLVIDGGQTAGVAPARD